MHETGTYVRIYVHCILHNYLKFRKHLELYTIQCAYITHTQQQQTQTNTG